jgi:hypothetical protein
MIPKIKSFTTLLAGNKSGKKSKSMATIKEESTPLRDKQNSLKGHGPHLAPYSHMFHHPTGHILSTLHEMGF